MNVRLTQDQAAALARMADDASAATAAVEMGEEPKTCPPVDPTHAIRLKRLLRNAEIVEDEA